MQRELPVSSTTIFEISGQKVLLDFQLAEMYGIPTKALLQAVRRNPERFPRDFCFKLGKKAFSSLRSQIVTSNGRGGRRLAPVAFTEHGVAMLSSVLNSSRAIQVNISIIRTFVRMRSLFATQAAVARKLDDLERRVDGHDEGIKDIFEAIRQMMTIESKSKPRIGFHTGDTSLPTNKKRNHVR